MYFLPLHSEDEVEMGKRMQKEDMEKRHNPTFVRPETLGKIIFSILFVLFSLANVLSVLK
jgi:hypothetical protein